MPTRFRPCIDLHGGLVKQIVGGTLTDDGTQLHTNYESPHPAAHYADLYRRDHLTGGHIIKLGPGNEDAARTALAAYPHGLQIGGGITLDNAPDWLTAGASHVIVTTHLFDPQGTYLPQRLHALSAHITPARLVIDLSCRRQPTGGWTVCMDRWQTRTTLPLTPTVLDELAPHCAEFLIHAADVEGKCQGMDHELIEMLGHWGRIPITYAGGARHLADLQLAHDLSSGRVDLTIGSALDIFGGTGIHYSDCIAWNHHASIPR